MEDSKFYSLEWPQWMYSEEYPEEDFLELAEAFQLVDSALRGFDSYREHVKMMSELSAALGGALDRGDETLDIVS